MQEEKASVILSDSTRTRELAIFLFYRVLIRLRNLLPVSCFSCLIRARAGEILRMGHVLLYLSTDIFFDHDRATQYGPSARRTVSSPTSLSLDAYLFG